MGEGVRRCVRWLLVWVAMGTGEVDEALEVEDGGEGVREGFFEGVQWLVMLWGVL